jgi:hypothetical protein
MKTRALSANAEALFEGTAPMCNDQFRGLKDDLETTKAADDELAPA